MKNWIVDEMDVKQMTDSSKVSDVFSKIAKNILFKTVLVIGGKHHRVTEIEFYLDSEVHQDPFVHGNDRQRTFGNWYFHRKGHHHCGLDITFGNHKSPFGVLIRAVEPVEKEQGLAVGPDLVVCRIESLLKDTHIAIRGPVEAKNIFDQSSAIHLQETKNPFPEELFVASPRVGLVLRAGKRASPAKEEFVMKPYRFLSKIYNGEEKTKQIELLCIDLHLKGYSLDQIKKFTSGSETFVNKYLAAFEITAPEVEFSKFYISGGAYKKNELCELYALARRNDSKPKFPKAA